MPLECKKHIAIEYAESIVSGARPAGKDLINCCRRFLEDLKRTDIELRTEKPDMLIELVERTMVHKQGEDIEGNPLAGKPFIFSPWQVFCVYNMCGWYYTGTQERRTKEAFIFVPRKNGKTSFVSALSWGLALLDRESGSKVYIVAASLKQALQSFEFLGNSLRTKGIIKKGKFRDNHQEHSFELFMPSGSLRIEALASNPDAQDSFNCNIAIADELHAFKKPAQYNRFKEAMKAYTNKLMIGITTAGDNVNSFCYQRLQYAKKVASGTVADDSLFAFISAADTDDSGDVDYMNPLEHEKANPGYGVTIRPADMAADALQAQNDPQQRKDFLSRSLNIYTSSMRSYFKLEEFQASDRKYDWTLQELAKSGIDWYGGADLSKMHDLTAAALYGCYKGVDIIITHAFFPIVAAHQKADEDGIPLFGWADDGLLTMCNSPTVNYADVVKWFDSMRKLGFRIKQVGHDRKFGREYINLMREYGFKVIDQPQYYYVKSEGFRHIEKAAKDGKLYYMHSEAYEYCVENVRAVEKTDDMVQYEKTQPQHRIDLFDASVFSCCRYLDNIDRQHRGKSWWSD